MRSVLALSFSALGCGAAAAKTDVVPVATVEVSKQADAVLVELDVGDADGSAVDNLRTAIRRSTGLSLDPASVSPNARRLLLRFEATTPTQSGASLERTLSLTGFTRDGECQIFRLAPKLTKPGGKKDRPADVDELTTAGVQNMVGTIEDLAPKIGPNATCVETGR